MRTKFLKIFLALGMVTSTLLTQGISVKALSQEDIVTIKGRLKEYFLELDTIDDGAKVETCFVSQAEEYLDLIQVDGSFDDVDYSATNNAANGGAWSPYLALDRLQAIVIAYHKEGSSLYQRADVIEKLNKAVLYWGNQNPRSTNWWENEVGVQLRFSRMSLFMKDVMSEEAMEVMLTKLLEKKPVKYGTGQNNLWFNQNYIYHAIITNDAETLKDMIDNYLNYCLSLQLDDNTKEAVQVDNSFFMHGRQFYSNGYGMSMFRDMSFWIYMLRETDYAVGDEVVDRMADYMLDGTSWTLRGDIMELYLGYREYKIDVGYKNYAAEYIDPLKRMIQADSKNATRYQQVLNNIQDPNRSNGKDGHYYMWRSGYASHMRLDYGVNIKMDSKNLVGGEWRGPWGEVGKPNQNLIYWTSTASSTVVVDGDEYTSVYPVFDWTHTPGATAPNYLSGKFNLENDELFNIGVTDGMYGATAYKFNKTNTKGQKGYFFFDDEFVALGSNISSTTDSPIHTTLNQSKASNVKVDGQSVALGTVGKEFNAKTIFNDKTGYVFFEDTKVQVSHDAQKEMSSLWRESEKDKAANVFTAYTDHGVKPTDGTYAYVVLPNVSDTEVETYSKNIPVTILENSENIQAVRHNELQQTQINFYVAGSVEYKAGHTISVDYPCSVLIDEKTSQVTVAVNEHEEHQVVNVVINNGLTDLNTRFVSKGIPYAGQSITLPIGADGMYTASSSTTGYPVEYCVDKDMDTYWESQTNSDEWVNLFVGKNTYINAVDIHWGNNYASDYDIYVSSDNVNFRKVDSFTQKKGGTDSIQIGEICEYVKIVMKKGPSTHFQIKEIDFKQSNLLSVNKPTTTSSVSTQAPTFVGSMAVDDSLTTRWASKRGSDDEWIIVDLQQISKIDAFEVYWEDACSDDYTIEVSSDKKTWTVVEQRPTDENLVDKICLSQSVEARYVKLHSHKTRLVNGTNYGINIYEFKIFGTYLEEEPVNIALNKPSKASSEYTNPSSNFVLESKYAFDGSVEDRGNTFQSRWVSYRRKEYPASEVDSQYISVDLEEEYDLSKVVLNWEGACGKEYKIQVSLDEENWTDITHVTDGKVGIIEFDYDQETIARYVRMEGIEPSNQYGYSLWEFEVYGDLVEEQEPVNIALNKPSKASSEYTNPNSKFVLESKYAFDGSTENKGDTFQSRWVSYRRKEYPASEVDSQYIYVDLEDYYNLSKVVLNWEGACGKEYKIQVSSDEENWTDITHVTDGKAGIIEFDYDQETIARYVRMEGIEPIGQYGYSLWEFEVYGSLITKKELTNSYNSYKNIDTSLYTPNTVLNYTEALSQIQKTINNDDATREEMAFVIIQLEKAVKGLVEKADISNLQKLLNDAKAIDQYLYTEVTIQALNDEIIKSEKLISNLNATQNEVDQCVVTLQESIDNLEKINFKEALENMLKDAKEIKRDLYTTVSLERLDQAVKEAELILEESNPNDEEIIEAYLTLKDSFDSLVEKVDTKELKETIQKAKSIDRSLYTEESLKRLDQAVLDAEAINAKEESTQEEVSQAVELLKNALSKLVYKIDKSKLASTIDNAQKVNVQLYTPKSITFLNKELDNAQKVYVRDNATQVQIDEANFKLINAIKSLVKKADKSQLKVLIQTAQTIDRNKYSEVSLKKLEEILKLAEKLYTDENVSQKEVDDICKKIEIVLKELEEKEKVQGSTNNKEEVYVQSKDNQLVETSDVSHSIYILLMLSSVVGYVMMRRRKV